ncbi:unnamed protein product [Effrenium voratum]|uniref:Cytochrome b5 heme-binding domain-containing protein n=1 Tax=Effrenium voratum TaxID=2562239 RepID=A0AA36IQM9_9DINO|nr:unnamed protein product [Effrenium voratum]|mmetsp:Transcript_72280/g.172591  ORF Transcript_72280/g.172591 Transcript_72280/m.172591 type:complete len:155 (+) Transcript_72280:54-518(+)
MGWFQRARESLFSVTGISTVCLFAASWFLATDLIRDYLAAKRASARRALEDQMRVQPRVWSAHELAPFDGSDPSKPILIGVDGEVFNVWRGRDFYGSNGPYGMFAGKDATRYFAKQVVTLEEDDGKDLTEEEKDNMKSWKEFLRYKYDFAGTLA